MSCYERTDDYWDEDYYGYEEEEVKLKKSQQIELLTAQVADLKLELSQTKAREHALEKKNAYYYSVALGAARGSVVHGRFVAASMVTESAGEGESTLELKMVNCESLFEKFLAYGDQIAIIRVEVPTDKFKVPHA